MPLEQAQEQPRWMHTPHTWLRRVGSRLEVRRRPHAGTLEGRRDSSRCGLISPKTPRRRADHPVSLTGPATIRLCARGPRRRLLPRRLPPTLYLAHPLPPSHPWPHRQHVLLAHTRPTGSAVCPLRLRPVADVRRSAVQLCPLSVPYLGARHAPPRGHLLPLRLRARHVVLAPLRVRRRQERDDPSRDGAREGRDRGVWQPRRALCAQGRRATSRSAVQARRGLPRRRRARHPRCVAASRALLPPPGSTH